jgi:hypothetical protein
VPYAALEVSHASVCGLGKGDPTLSVLSAFLAVAEERSFTRAAKRLGVSVC